MRCRDGFLDALKISTRQFLEGQETIHVLAQPHLPQLGQLHADHLRNLVQVVAVVLVREIDPMRLGHSLQSGAHLGRQYHLQAASYYRIPASKPESLQSRHAGRLQQQQLPPELFCSRQARNGQGRRGLPSSALEVTQEVVQVPVALRLQHAFEDLLQLRS